MLAVERPAVDLNDAAELTQTEADLPLLGEHDMDDLQCRILTSGTSGAPRPVDLTYGNFLFSAVGSAFNIGVEPEDRWLCCLPLSHVAGLSIILRSVIYGTTAVLLDGFDTELVASTLVSGEISLLSLVPTQLNRLLEAGADLFAAPGDPDRGRAAYREDTLRAALDRGATVVQTYGLTETCSQVTTLAPADAERKVGSAGRPLLTSHVRIEDGEILVQGPTVSRPAIDPDGWLHTGDLGHIDDEGYLYVTGRRSEVIVTGGENVMPAEVEAVLLSHPAVADAAVLGRARSGMAGGGLRAGGRRRMETIRVRRSFGPIAPRRSRRTRSRSRWISSRACPYWVGQAPPRPVARTRAPLASAAAWLPPTRFSMTRTPISPSSTERPSRSWAMAHRATPTRST